MTRQPGLCLGPGNLVLAALERGGELMLAEPGIEGRAGRADACRT